MSILERITVTPLKGTALHHPERVDLTPSGIEGDRRFFLIDAAGQLISGDTLPRLVRLHVDHVEEEGVLRVTFPDREVVGSDAGPGGEAVETDFYGRAVAGSIVAGAVGEAISAFVGAEVRVVRVDRDGDASDVHHLTMVSVASVDDLGRRGRHEGRLDSRRFRMNLELGGCEPYEEDSWDGRLVRVGEAVVRVHGQVPRCRFTTLSPDTGEKDFDTLTQIAKYRPLIPGKPRGIPFGVYAEVETPGVARVGDTVAPV